MDPTKTMPGRWKTAITDGDLDAWMEARNGKNMYHAHIHSEDDSYLQCPNGITVTHAGYRDFDD